jgi:heme exporter protein D
MGKRGGEYMSITEFFAMGGYAFYVWSSFGISFVLMLFGILRSIHRHKKVKNKIKQAIVRQKILN